LRQALTDKQLDRLQNKLVERLRCADLPAPTEREREPVYTTRCLIRPVEALLDDLAIPGLLVAGEQAAPVQPVYLLGSQFFPDITVSYHSQPLIAVEVKYLKGGGSVAVAIGQSVLYGLIGYRRSVMFVIDRNRKTSADEVLRAVGLIRKSSGIELVVRRQARGKLLAQQRP
jgi:hypothetical protein